MPGRCGRNDSQDLGQGRVGPGGPGGIKGMEILIGVGWFVQRLRKMRQCCPRVGLSRCISRVGLRWVQGKVQVVSEDFKMKVMPLRKA